VNLTSFAEYLRAQRQGGGAVNFSFNPASFCGMSLRAPGKRGGLILFDSGRFSILGAGSVAGAGELFGYVRDLLRGWLGAGMTSPPEQSLLGWRQKRPEERGSYQLELDSVWVPPAEPPGAPVKRMSSWGRRRGRGRPRGIRASRRSSSGATPARSTALVPATLVFLDGEEEEHSQQQQQQLDPLEAVFVPGE
jgi:hypothetical protein